MSAGILAGVDIGSEKVTCVIAEVDEQDVLHITGAGQAPTDGSIRDGVIVDLQGASEAVSIALEEAESISSWKIVDTAVSISGTHVRGFPGRGIVNVDMENDSLSGEVSWMDIEDAMETAQLIKLPRESMVLRIEKCGYSIDGFNRLMKPPVGLRAEKLTADIFMVIADRTAVLNLEQVVRNAGRRVSSVIPAASAGARAVLSRDEMEMGVVYVDIGASTTDIAVFHSGILAHLAVISTGGEAITRDLQQMRIPRSEAERLKKEYADISVKEKAGEKTITVNTFGGRNTIPISKDVISGIALHRIRELMEQIFSELKQAGIHQSDLPAGIVLTGGTSHLAGIAHATSRITGLPSEVGSPAGLDMSSSLTAMPEFSTAIGLLILSLEEDNNYEQQKGMNQFGNIVDHVKRLLNRLR